MADHQKLTFTVSKEIVNDSTGDDDHAKWRDIVLTELEIKKTMDKLKKKKSSTTNELKEIAKEISHIYVQLEEIAIIGYNDDFNRYTMSLELRAFNVLINCFLVN